MASPSQAGERFVVVGLALARSRWFEQVGRWATNGIVPVEFIRCISVEEVRARISSGRAFSALLIDASVPGADRDLFDVAAENDVQVLVIDDGRVDRDWGGLGAAAVMAPSFDRQEMLDNLIRHATPVGRVDDGAQLSVATSCGPSDANGRLVVVIGGSGAGTSTVAMAVAQSLGDIAELEERALLADLAIRADQAMHHDAKDVVPGLQELVEAHRNGVPSEAEVRSMVFKPHDRGYHLLLGLRRHQDWTVLRPRAVQSCIDSLLSSYRVVVADINADIEGEEETGSVEVEERNTLARSSVRRADVVVVVGTPTTKGLNDLVRTINDLAKFGVPGKLILPVLNRTPRSMRSRTGVAGALSTLLQPISSGVGNAVHLPHKPRIEDSLRDGTRLPLSFSRPIGDAVQAALKRHVYSTPADHIEPVLLTPGSIGQLSSGAWKEDGAA